jgi:hypothetical protein
MKKGVIIWTIIGIIILIFGTWIVMNNSLPEDSQNEGNKTYCDSKSREGEYCMKIYSPVCGWMGPNIQCIKYPCAGNYGNSCEACHDENVEYYTSGECPN